MNRVWTGDIETGVTENSMSYTLYGYLESSPITLCITERGLQGERWKFIRLV